MPRRAPRNDFPLPPRDAKAPLHRWLYGELRAAIVGGRLTAGMQLPSTRSLSQQHSIARATVVEVYEQLQAEGYLVSRMGSGTKVAGVLPDRFHAAQPTSTRRRVVCSAAQPSQRARAWSAEATLPEAPVQPFAVCVPGVNEFPLEEWARLAGRRLRLSRADLLRQGDPRGWRPLREAVAAHLAAARSVTCDPDQVVIVSGTQQAFDFVGRITFDPGDPVWVEDPGYRGAVQGFAAAGARTVRVPLDQQGLDLTAGIQREASPRLIYVTPAHQFPLGLTMSLERRLALVNFAERTGAWIFEDDYDGEFRYDVRPIGSLQSHDRTGCVIYVGTFNKMMFPTLRLGYVVLPPRLVEPFLGLRDSVDRYLPTLEQAVMADFMREGLFERHVRRSRALYLERRDALLAAGERYLSPHLALQSTPAGFQLPAKILNGLTDTAVETRAAARGVRAVPLSRFYSDRSRARRDTVLLGFAAFTPSAIRTAAARLADALAK